MSELGRQLRIFGDATGKFQQPRKNDEDAKHEDMRVMLAIRTIKDLMERESLTFEQAVAEYFGFIRPVVGVRNDIFEIGTLPSNGKVIFVRAVKSNPG